MARGSQRRMNRGPQSSQLVSEHPETGNVAAENGDPSGDLSGDESTHGERLAQIEERIDQQTFVNQQLSSKMEEITSQLQFLVQELKNSKAARGPEAGSDGGRGILGPGGSQEPSILGSGLRENLSEMRSSPHWGNNSKNSFFSNQKLVQPKSLRLDFPSFSGIENVVAWLSQVEQIFAYYDIKSDE